MRIQAFSRKMGISKRTIHFYIQQGLLLPRTNHDNGYYDFTEEDEKRLTLVKILRDAGFSISAIHSLLKTPGSAEYHFRMRLERMRQEKKTLNRIEEGLTAALCELPINPDFDTLYRQVTNSFVNDKDSEPSYDGHLVNHFLWRTFWQEEPLSEYQQFLWEKINRMTCSRDKNPDYARVYDYLCSQERSKIDILYAERNQHYVYVAALSDEGVLQYAEEMKRNIIELIHNNCAVKNWKRDMLTLNRSLIRIYTSDIGRIAEEMCPLFHQYKSKSTQACQITYEWLHTRAGEKTLSEINAVLGECLELDDYNHAELESLSMPFPMTDAR